MNPRSWKFTRPTIGFFGAVFLALATQSICAAASLVNDRSPLPIRFHTAALQESPFQKFSATYFEGNLPVGIANNLFTTLRPAASTPGKSHYVMRLIRTDGSDGARSAFVVWTATDRRCEVTYNSAAAQSSAGDVPGREYEIFSIAKSSFSSVPGKGYSRTFCAPENARFDVTFNAAGPKALPIVISTLSATDDTNILNRFVWFITL
ncbi:hypothetical protein ACSFA3_15410 [Variovorax sp. RHLX14]|uniref:hypothetical protein n=1 Tax=Variovorax sp. RHLX14 TaxID=1259731 RepID=UPI003F489EAF